MKNSSSLVLFAGLGLGLYFFLSGEKDANAKPSSGGLQPVGGGNPLDPNALPELIMANFPTPGQVPMPSLTPQQIQPELNPLSIPVPPPVTVDETPIVPPATANAPSAVPDDTAALVRLLLADEASGNWKKKVSAVGLWQGARGLKKDNMFGPVTAERMALEIGSLPLIRYYPKGSIQGKAVEAYRDRLEAIAAQAPEPRKSQLLAAAAREQGQSFAAKPGRPKTVISI